MPRKNLPWLIIVIVLALTGGLGGLLDEEPVWIMVNERPIYKVQIQRIIFLIRNRMARDGFSQEEILSVGPVIKHSAMRLMVQIEVLRQEVDSQNITVDDAAVEAEMVKIRNQFANRAEYDTHLAELKSTEQELKIGIRQILRYRRLMEQSVTLTQPTEKEIEALYQASKTRMTRPAKATILSIFLAVPPGAGSLEKRRQRMQADSILMQVRAGGDFRELARRYSESRSRPDGGMEIIVKGKQPGPIEDAVFAMKSGQLSDVIETPAGFYIIKLIDIMPERTPTMSESREELIQKLITAQLIDKFQAYIDERVKQAKVEYLEPLPKFQPPKTGREIISIPV